MHVSMSDECLDLCVCDLIYQIYFMCQGNLNIELSFCYYVLVRML